MEEVLEANIYSQPSRVVTLLAVVEVAQDLFLKTECVWHIYSPFVIEQSFLIGVAVHATFLVIQLFADLHGSFIKDDGVFDVLPYMPFCSADD